MNKIFFLVFFVLSFSCSQLPTKRTDKLSILQGVTNTRSVEFSILVPKEKVNLNVELRSAEGEIIKPEASEVEKREFSDYVIHKVIFPRSPDKDYNLYVYDGTSLLDQRLVGKGQKDRSRLKLAVVSCMDDFQTKELSIWDTLAEKNPEYLLMIGDNVYADKKNKQGLPQEVNPENLWNRYVDVRLTLPIFFQEKLIPVHALWDDHDFGQNNGNETYAHKEASKEIFEAFFAQELSEDEWIKGFGVGGALTLGDFNFYFLDGRSFRSPKTNGKHLGENQESWLLAKMKDEVAPSFLVKGDQFFGGYHTYESFEGSHPENFQSFNGNLKKLPTPFIFLSGDRHLSEIMQFPRSLFGKPSFEITSSPIHSSLYPDSQDLNPWRVVSNKSDNNFTIVNNLAQDNHWFLDVEAFNKSGKSLYKRELAVFIKDLQDNLQEVRKKRSGKRRYRRIKRRR